jgi:hypothetical protein
VFISEENSKQLQAATRTAAVAAAMTMKTRITKKGAWKGYCA